MPQYQGVWSLQQQMQALTSGQWATDPLFDYTTLLLQADDAANSAQNNTFLDSSTNAFAITRNGNTTQGTFSPFSLQPGAWANYFNGSSYLTAPANTAFAFGTGNLTVEMWLYITAYPGSSAADYFCPATNRPYNAGDSTTWMAIVYGDGTFKFSDSLGTQQVSTTATIPLNRWTHVAVVRSSTSTNGLTIYFNGVAVAQGTNSINFSSTANTLIMGWANDSTAGRYLNGYMSNLRIVKGSAVYTANFNPPTEPLTAVTNTQLLTCQSNRFVDNSTNAFSITVTGTPSVQAFSPFAPQYQYTATGTGGSGYFDGTGDYLQSSGDFFSGQGTARTFQCWIYVVSMPGAGTSQGIFSGANSGGNLSFRYDSSGTLKLDNTGTVEIATSASGAIKTGQWTHVAVTRTTGNLYTLYVNGSSVGSGTNSTSMGSSTYIGSLTTGSTLNGYMAGVRVTNTVETISVPTAPLTAISGTALLLNFTNAGILDGTMKNNLETVGNAQVSTSVVKYGSGSLAFDGTGDWLTTPLSPWMNLGTSDFTMECWVYFTSVSSTQMFFSSNYNAGTGAGGWAFLYRQDNTTIKFTCNSNVSYEKTWVPVVGTWYHVAVSRANANLRIFVNGVQLGTTSTSTDNIASASTLYVGSNVTTQLPLFGYMDDARITVGVARYTQNFIPPSVALPRQ